MTTSWALAGLVALLGAGCGGAEPRAEADWLMAGRQPTAEVRAACDVTAHLCTRCHPIERLLLARVEQPTHWENYVERMRHQPGSNISLSNGRVIVRCLVFHSFGEAGLDSLDAMEKGASP